MVRRHGELGQIALALLAGGALITLVALAPNAVGPLARAFLSFKKEDPWRTRRSLRRMVRQRYVEIISINGVEVIKITEKGKTRALRYQLDTMSVARPKKWDRKWRLVIFDIPEKKKIARETLRRKLTAMDFVRIQKSVFIHPFPCREQIEFLREVYQLRPYFIYLEATHIEDEAKYRRRFEIL